MHAKYSLLANKILSLPRCLAILKAPMAALDLHRLIAGSTKEGKDRDTRDRQLANDF